MPNKKLQIAFIVLLCLLVYTNCFAQNIVINELMANNESSIADTNNEFSDWIELYNKSDQAINIENYQLSDDKSNLGKWKFPSINILPKGYLLVFASGNSIKDSNELHANFKISAQGETLFLSNPSNKIIDSTIAIELNSNEVYMRYPDGIPEWFIASSSTPNNPNQISNRISFSKQSGYCDKPFDLMFSSLLGDPVFYTLDGSIPTTESLTYSGAIPIKNNSSNPNIISLIPTTTKQSDISYKSWETPRSNIDKATIIRCASYKNGKITSKIYSQTYFVFNDTSQRYSLPVVSLITDNNNFFEKDTGIYVPGINFNNENPEWTGNFFMSGDAWERPVHIEYYENNGDLAFSQDAGIRIHGGKTRQTAQKSLRLYAREEYGTKNFNYQLLPQRTNLKYKRFLLRTTMGAWGRKNIVFKDVYAHELVSNLDLEIQYYQPIILFLNGEYWGIHTLRDRIDERYIEYISGYDKDSIDLLDVNSQVISGSNYEYLSLISFIETNDLSVEKNFEYVKSKIDINNYIDYHIAQMFITNHDWPANNIKLWKPRSNDGKWRWIFYDLDAGFGNYEYNMLAHTAENNENIVWPNSPESTLLFRKLITNNNFKNQFIDRYTEILNNNFSREVMLGNLNKVKVLYEKEIRRHIARWNYPSSFYDWEYDISENILQFIENRHCITKQHIEDFFVLDNYSYECLSSNNIISNFIITPNPSRGDFNIINNVNETFSGSYYLANISGQIIYKKAFFSLSTNEKENCNIQDIPSGIYILSISNASNTYFERRKIIVIN